MFPVKLSSAPPMINHQAKEITRPSPNYHPSVWGDFFLKHTLNDKISDASTTQRIDELKEEVKKTFVNLNDSRELMTLIDVIQHTGVAYHFETYIEEVMKQLHMSNTSGPEKDDDDLSFVALRFRLLRQHGYKAPSDVFKRFKDADGEFKGSLKSDLRGLLSLYEATYFGVQGEEILDEALVYCKNQLNSLLPQLEPVHAKQVRHALELPFHKGTWRLNTKQYITSYQQEEARSKVLLELAKLDFNKLQAQHQREIHEISRWWKEMDLLVKLPFIRDRTVECYFWILELYFEPEYERARKITTQILTFISMLDDIYDEFATLEELHYFTHAIDRWDAGIIHQLPDCLKVAYLALFNTVMEIEERLASHERFRIIYLKKAIASLSRVYFVEAQWRSSGYVPTFEEYMKVASISSSYAAVTVTSFVGMNEAVREQDFEWAFSIPTFLKASCIVGRLKNDLVGYKAEQERGKVASGVECYMYDNGCSEEEACEKLHEMVTNAWKDMNQESFLPTPIPTYLTTRVLNLARVSEVYYQYGDGYTDSTREIKSHITSVLVHPFLL